MTRPTPIKKDSARDRARRKLWRIDPGDYDPKRDPHAFGEPCRVAKVETCGNVLSPCLHNGIGGVLLRKRGGRGR